MAMTLRLSADLDTALRETAAQEGRSLHETVVVAITEYTSRRDRQREALIARIMDEDRQALDQLGSV